MLFHFVFLAQMVLLFWRLRWVRGVDSGRAVSRRQCMLVFVDLPLAGGVTDTSFVHRGLTASLGTERSPGGVATACRLISQRLRGQASVSPRTRFNPRSGRKVRVLVVGSSSVRGWVSVLGSWFLLMVLLVRVSDPFRLRRRLRSKPGRRRPPVPCSPERPAPRGTRTVRGRWRRRLCCG